MLAVKRLAEVKPISEFGYSFSAKPKNGAWFSIMRGWVCGKRPCSDRWEFGESQTVARQNTIPFHLFVGGVL
jgi:hypothetical protein